MRSIMKRGQKNTVLLSIEQSQYLPYLKECANTEAHLHVDDNKKTIFKLCRNFMGDKHDIVGEKCIKKDDGSITFSDAEKPTAWKDHYKHLLNIEFS